jgi:transposase-like protein
MNMESKIECPGCGAIDIMLKDNLYVNGDIVDYFRCLGCGWKFTVQSSFDDEEFQDDDA